VPEVHAGRAFLFRGGDEVVCFVVTESISVFEDFVNASSFLVIEILVGVRRFK
jgi:hypothetical protein